MYCFVSLILIILALFLLLSKFHKRIAVNSVDRPFSTFLFYSRNIAATGFFIPGFVPAAPCFFNP